MNLNHNLPFLSSASLLSLKCTGLPMTTESTLCPASLSSLCFKRLTNSSIILLKRI